MEKKKSVTIQYSQVQGKNTILRNTLPNCENSVFLLAK